MNHQTQNHHQTVSVLNTQPRKELAIFFASFS